MQGTLIRHLGKHVDEEVSIQGWLYNKRSSGKIQFLIVRDGTGLVQGVLVKKEAPEIFELAKELTQESAIRLRGIVREEPRSMGGYELTVTGLEIINLAQEYPISHKEHGVDFLMDRRHLWMRTPRQNAILRIRAEIEQAARDFFNQNDFTLVDSPIITPAACEGTTTLFELDYHGEKAYLSQSGQLYNEASAMAVGRMYCFGPTFRAEKSKTRRHLMEFWMIEAEAAFFDFEDNMKLQEEMVYFIVQRVLERRRQDLELLGRDISKLEAIKLPFPRLSYTEAVELLKSKGEAFEWGEDFGAPHETIISENFESPVFIHRYPTEIKAFYMKPDPEDGRVVLGADLIAPEGYGEMIGGGQRIDDLQLLEQRLEEHKLPKEAFEWYLDLRRYGSVPHSGFGLGLERTVAWICKLDHVRETIPYPRMLYRVYP
ncbi:asparaginyl-tRNA synthetase [Desulforamulus reducens MI-1]|uniref:Asparagine--tRNA ligase n=1 Tax=Desulforamulus reducens (strain ATCC BAA-1160 / DSM 100696 / MI-1) TaxID=349161 RepID=SYN_DESRM|nr:asparagine--tRNA ligase [Desulforamulus reducens]A4J412.1 RecName: Full=Asparagine--tRNA ligase; AltName: Full=Asparaginyl-tRNA synthetase; Short=AsnRS [Desulforamulus reducens MI-1]ABO49815.1 asparaginyl-tRNA synthetase [Desulforamulus reducens MI-1]